jgi:hypothetical protein
MLIYAFPFLQVEAEADQSETSSIDLADKEINSILKKLSRRTVVSNMLSMFKHLSVRLLQTTCDVLQF